MLCLGLRGVHKNPEQPLDICHCRLLVVHTVQVAIGNVSLLDWAVGIHSIGLKSLDGFNDWAVGIHSNRHGEKFTHPIIVNKHTFIMKLYVLFHVLNFRDGIYALLDLPFVALSITE